MGIVLLLFSFAFLILSFLKFKNRILNPAVLFFGLWTFILFLSNLSLYGLDKPSNEAYFLLFLMLLCFFIGSYFYEKITKIFSKLKEKLFFKKKIKKIKNNKEIINKKRIIDVVYDKLEEKKIIKKVLKEDRTADLKFKIIYFLIFLLILFTVIDCIVVIKGLSSGVPMWQIRRWGMGVFGVDSNPMLDRRSFIEEAFRSIILTPFETLLPAIAAYSLFSSKTRKNKYLLSILAIIVLVLTSFAGGGGRLGFIYYFGCFLLAFLVFSSKSKFSKLDFKKYKKYILAFLISSFLIVVLYTCIRSGAGNFIEEVYTYFALPPTLLSKWIDKLQGVSHTYGLLTFFGVYSYAFRVFETLGLIFLIPSVYTDVFQHLLNAEIFLEIGCGVANAFVTPVYYFFIDGGYIFVCISSLFFGYLVSKFYKYFINKITLKSFVLYALVMYGIFVTFMRIQTAIPSYIISFIMVYFLIEKKEVN